MSFHRFELNQFQAVHFNRIFFILQTSFLFEKVCVIIMHLKQSSQKLIIMLVYKNFTAAKQVTCSEAGPDNNWIKSLMLIHLS